MEKTLLAGFSSVDLLIFDLDGTLIDSKLDLVHSVNAARAHMDLPPIEPNLISSYVGNGAPMLIRRALGPGATEEQIEEALRFFLQYYGDHKLDYTDLYPGVRETLDQLHHEGVKLAVLTNKPVRISQAIIDGLNLTDHFFRVYGGNSFGEKKPHPVGIHTLLDESGVERSRALMVGDSAVDVKTARNAGIQAAGVTYGFQPETLIAEPPDILVDRMEDLGTRVLEMRARE